MSSETSLTVADQQQLDQFVSDQITAQLGALPTLQTLKAQGYHEARWVTGIIDFISGAGRVITLFAAETAQAFAALALACLFILLEAERIKAGVMALGQAQAQATMIAIGFTTANFVLPLYQLRNVQDRATLTRKRATVRGYLGAFWRRLVFKPSLYEVAPQDNPTLAIMESAVTWATIFLALYAVMGPMIARYSAQVWYSALWSMFTQSNLAQIIELIAGALISIGGVFGVQSISWEFGVRRAIDKPQRLTDVLEAKQGEYNASAAAIRETIRSQYLAALTTQRESVTVTPESPVHEVTVIPIPLSVPISQNGHNHL